MGSDGELGSIGGVRVEGERPRRGCRARLVADGALPDPRRATGRVWSSGKIESRSSWRAWTRIGSARWRRASRRRPTSRSLGSDEPRMGPGCPPRRRAGRRSRTRRARRGPVVGPGVMYTRGETRGASPLRSSSLAPGGAWGVRRPDRVARFSSSKHRSRHAPVWIEAPSQDSSQVESSRARVHSEARPQPPKVPTWRPRNTPVPRSIAWPRVRVPVRPRVTTPLRAPDPPGRISRDC